MAEPRIRIDIDGPIATITVARPEKLNAFDIDMLKELSAACDAVEANAAVRVAILTGEGKAFSAGGDIRAWAGMEANEFGHAWVRFGHRVFERLATLRMPLIAAVNGHALGGGLELAAAADIRIAESQVKIGLPEAGLGMVPGWSGTQRLVRRFGAQAVRRMLLGGEVLTAGEAAALGIVDQVVETGTSVAAAKAYAALAPGGRALTLDFIPEPDRITPPSTAGFALVMLATTARGDAYTFAEYEAMFGSAGFARSEFHSLPPTTQQAVVSHKA